MSLVAAAALLLLAAPASGAAPAGSARSLTCASGGTRASSAIAVPAGVSRISGVARRTVGRPGGRRIPGVTAGFQLTIGLLDASRTSFAGMFLESGSPEAGPPQVAHHFFGSFGRYRTGARPESAQPLDGLFPFVTAPGDVIRFALELRDGGVHVRASWDGGESPRAAGGVVPAWESGPVQLIVQCEVDDFAIEELVLS